MEGTGALDLAPTDISGIVRWAREELPDLVVAGPETPLALGLSDQLAEIGVLCFGPSAAAARIESSKAFAKELMRTASVPTADFEVFDDADAAERSILDRDRPVVVKASGLAGGKGALVCDDAASGARAARAVLGGSFGDAGRRIVVEERLQGEELSVFFLARGEESVPLLPSQDHKRLLEGDKGPNTGGMGAYAPVGIADAPLVEEVERCIARPALRALAERGAPFSGLLYAGLMLTPEGPKVIEFNCRFGDPETQAVLPLLESSLLELMLWTSAAASFSRPVFREGSALATVVAAENYPGACDLGAPVEIPEASKDALVFHAGTARARGGWVSSGGRVLAAVGLGRDFAGARRRSLELARGIGMKGKQFRTDIGWREAAR